MSIELITLLLFGALVVALILGLPMAFVMGGIAVVATYFLWGAKGLTMIVFQTFGWMQNLILVAAPLFIFMGLLLERSGIAESLYETMYRWSGSLRGGLAMGTVAICSVFAAMTGVTAAATITMGLIALPSMLSRNYDKGIAVGSIAGGGTLGILIPPSVFMVILGVVTGESVGKLFMGGIFSGFLLSLLFIAYIGIRSFLNPQLCPPSKEKFTLTQKIHSLVAVILPLFLIMAVLGSIFLGVATPTEAAAVGAFGALLCTFIYRRFTWQLLKDVCYRVLRLSGMVFWIIIGASCFTSVYTSVGGTQLVGEIVAGLQMSPWLVVIGMLLILFIMGMFLDPGAIIMLTAPVFFPILRTLGFDPIWFGILFIINLQMGYITPPFGYNLFYMKSVVPPTISMGDIYRSIIPFVGLMILGTALILIFPQIALWLPSVMTK